MAVIVVDCHYHNRPSLKVYILDQIKLSVTFLTITRSTSFCYCLCQYFFFLFLNEKTTNYFKAICKNRNFQQNLRRLLFWMMSYILYMHPKILKLSWKVYDRPKIAKPQGGRVQPPPLPLALRDMHGFACALSKKAQSSLKLLFFFFSFLVQSLLYVQQLVYSQREWYRYTA